MTSPTDRNAWAGHHIEAVAPGVHRVALPLPDDGLRAVNVYLLEEDDGLVMIDGGWAIPESRARLEQALAALGHDLGEVKDILVTHVHRDHYTQAVDLRRSVGARVYLGAGEKPNLKTLAELRSPRPLTTSATLRRHGATDLAARIEQAGLGPFDPEEWQDPDVWLGEDVLEFGSRTLRVIPTPGHTRGHVVFLDAANGLLFAGDHVLPHITPSIGHEPAPVGLPLADYLDSLHLMTTLADARLLPAHGPVTGSMHARVRELQNHHDVRLGQTLAVLVGAAATNNEGTSGSGGGGGAALTAYDVAQRLLWTRHERAFDELTDYNRMLAVNETAAHLDVLVTRGELDASSHDGVTRYTRR
jgi:glyoxylase-like metal-dependent hydrolase (beta-lactamase superfamily II)